MKKSLCLILVCLLLFSAVSSVFAADEAFDLSYVRGSSDIYTIDVNTDSDVAFVESAMTVKERAFSHRDESDALYSYVWFDMLVVDYSKASRYPVFRMWISLCTETGYKDITSVTFTVDGQEFTFSRISDDAWYSMKEDDYRQQMLIKFGTGNDAFIIALERYINKILADGYSGSADVRMVLHGAEEIETSLSLPFLLDFSYLKTAMLRTNGVKYMDKANDTPMTGHPAD